MFFVKSKVDNKEVKIYITDKNVFCNCNACGKELQINLSDVLDEDFGLMDTIAYCKKCVAEENLKDRKENDK